MSLRWFYRPSWRNTIVDPTVEFTQHVRLYTFDTTENAEEGSVATWNVTVDDPDAVLDFPPLTVLYAVEDEIASSSNTYVAYGVIAEREVRRGDSALTDRARIWNVSVVDANSMLTRRVLSSNDANRPAETDVARVQWLAAEADGQQLIDDTQFLSTASPVNMDAADYRGQNAQDVLNDCAQQSGKNYWAWFSELVGIGIWYGHENLTAYSSMVRLSNDLDDIDELFTFPIGLDETRLVRDPSRLLSSVMVEYANGSVYVRNQNIIQEIGLRDGVMAAPNVKSLATATARANRYLNTLDTEDDRIYTQVRLPAAKVNWIRAGMRVQVKATHLPGYGDGFTWMRVLRRSVAQDSEETYLLTLELSAGDAVVESSCSVTGYDATSGVAVYGTVFTNTVSGFYPHNSVNGNFGDYVNGQDARVFYMGSIGGFPRTRPVIVTDPSTGLAGGWNFRQYGVAKAGMPLGTADGGLGGPEKVEIIVIGAGTLTVYATSTESATWDLYRVTFASDFPVHGDTSTVIDSGDLSFPSTVIEVPNDGACLHYVVLTDPDGVDLYYGGHDWLAAS